MSMSSRTRTRPRTRTSRPPRGRLYSANPAAGAPPNAREQWLGTTGVTALAATGGERVGRLGDPAHRGVAARTTKTTTTRPPGIRRRATGTSGKCPSTPCDGGVLALCHGAQEISREKFSSLSKFEIDVHSPLIRGEFGPSRLPVSVCVGQRHIRCVARVCEALSATGNLNFLAAGNSQQIRI